MIELAQLEVTVHGCVQGVFYRVFTQRQARSLGLTGYVRNLPDGASVEVRAEGVRGKLEELIDRLWVGPYGARVERVDTQWSEFKGRFDDFEIWR